MWIIEFRVRDELGRDQSLHCSLSTVINKSSPRSEGNGQLQQLNIGTAYTIRCWAPDRDVYYIVILKKC